MKRCPECRRDYYDDSLLYCLDDGKGQITIPLKVRTALGVKEGDKLVFEQNGDEMTVRPQKRESRFAKYAGIGNPGIGKGREAVISYVRSLRDPE